MMELSSLMETDKQRIMMQRQAIDLANTLKWYISDLKLVKIKQKNIEILCTNLHFAITFPPEWTNVIDSQIEEAEATILKIYHHKFNPDGRKVTNRLKMYDEPITMEIDSSKLTNGLSGVTLGNDFVFVLKGGTPLRVSN